ncbi:MAG TPA: TetR family transcriptional regulator [Nevskiaceae bacterium]|nr:TetR family transcriptional regulator [Nevskiaceae bacterium]
MGAALELAATTRSLASLGLREVARAAGLNPNTFYRHFKSFDELGLALIERMGVELRAGLRERRLRPASQGFRLSPVAEGGDLTPILTQAQDIIRQSIGLVLDFVTDNKEAYIVGIRELHGTSPVLRKAMRDLLDAIAQDMTEDVLGKLALPLIDRRIVEEISQLAIRQMTFFSLDYLEQPDRRDVIKGQAERFILLLFWGAIAAKAPDLLTRAKVKFPFD